MSLNPYSKFGHLSKRVRESLSLEFPIYDPRTELSSPTPNTDYFVYLSNFSSCLELISSKLVLEQDSFWVIREKNGPRFQPLAD